MASPAPLSAARPLSQAHMLDLEDIFGHGGPLHRALPDFKARHQQLRMAERVAAALEHRETLAVEAGTGTGKTFAYLVPALLSGARVLISTGTRTLQDQLFSKDLPLVAAALGRPAKVALLKGRSNYLCRYRLAQADAQSEQLELDSSFGNRAAAPEKMLTRIRSWARTTRMGDLSEIRGLSDSHAVWPQVTSTRENCLGNRCPEVSRCHVAVARRQALDSDIVIVNHHLLLADLALKEDGFGDILGSSDAVILDEAHQIPDLATQFFGANVSSRRIEAVLKDLHAEMGHAPAPFDLTGAMQAVEELEGARAVETSQRGFALSLMPFDISARFQAMLQARRCAWVFTSATLSLGEDFSHFTGRLGLADIPTLKIDSPFNYERQSLLYLPVGMPEPAAPGYVAAVIDKAVGLIDASRGGAFVLFTSHRALTQGAVLLRERWGQLPPYRLYVQG